MSIMFSRQLMSRVTICIVVLLYFMSNHHSLQAQPGATMASTTTASYKKSNQNKLFYHDGSWWALGFHEAQAAWYLWKYNGSSWTRTNKLEKSTNYFMDMVLDSAANKLYTFGSHHTKPRFRSYSYVGGIWVKDFSSTKFRDFINADHGNPVSMVQGLDDKLWLFRVDSNRLQTRYSADDGQTWSSVITIKSGLNQIKGTTDAVAFTMSAAGHIGVGYAEVKTAGSEFGFLYHKDSDPDNVWTDETSQLTYFGTEEAKNDICMTVDNNSNIYMFVRTGSGTSADPRNTLYKRPASGTWSAYIVNTVGSGLLWGSPAAAIDGENNKLYLMGTNNSNGKAEYKVCNIGNEGSLSATAAQTLMASGSNTFKDISVPTGQFHAATGIMVTGDNETTDDIWFTTLALLPDTNTTTQSVTVGDVIVNSCNIADTGAYTIPVTLGSSGALTGSIGTITTIWPAGTTIPASISNSNVLIDGVVVSAGGVTTTPGSRKVVITVPATLAAGSSPTIFFSAAANITNPAIAGNYVLEVITSAQTDTADSPLYAITTPAPASVGTGAVVTNSGAEFEKPNQSRVFYHGGNWWLTALKGTGSEWKLWKLDGATWIEQSIVIASNKSDKPDCVVDGPNNKLYIFVGANSSSYFMRLSYSAGSWSIDSGYPTTGISAVTNDGENPVSFSRSNNGELWAFQIISGSLIGVCSTDEGVSWTGAITVKSGLNHLKGLVDCAPFSSGGTDYMGVCYGENTSANSIFGFLKHEDGVSHNTWTDETAELTPFSGTEADDHCNMVVADNGTVYIVTKTDGGGNTVIDNGLYKRSPSGGWQQFAFMRGSSLTRPALGIDETSGTLYAFGTLLGSMKYGKFKKIAMGNESQLEFATEETIFQSGTQEFVNLSLAQHPSYASTGMLVTVQNDLAKNVWYNVINLGGGASGALSVKNVSVNPNGGGTTGSYTISIRLGTPGALSNGSDTITLTWPVGTTIPGSITNTNVTVNGINPQNGDVTTSPGNREVSIIVPNDLADGEAVTLSFTTAAGIINPLISGQYTLTVRTSIETTDIISPIYEIPDGPVTVHNVTVTPDTIGQTAGYLIPITLGQQSGLTANTGTITITWPSDTQVPGVIVPAAVTVNGVNATAVTTNSLQRQATVTVPNSISNGDSLTLLFNNTAGLVNPTIVGNYSLTAYTSIQTDVATSPFYTILSDSVTPPPTGGIAALVHPDTKDTFGEPNQSKLFYHSGSWWLVAYDDVEGDWFLWKYSSGTWTRDVYVESSSKARIDIVTDTGNNKIFILVSHKSDSKFIEATFSSGTWTLGTPVILTGFNHSDADFPMSMIRGANGDLWIFRIFVQNLEAIHSTDDGQNWSSSIAIKLLLNLDDGLTDCVAFSDGGTNYIGVFYGLDDNDEFGFLKHNEADSENSWSDESSQIDFFGDERSTAQFSAMAAADGTVYVNTATTNASESDPTNTLYKRSSGSWSKFKINTADSSTQWLSPVLAIDQTSNRLFVMGAEDDVPHHGEYKFCNLGSEATLETQAAITLFENGLDEFANLGAPAAPFTSVSGLMIAASNQTSANLWYNLLVPGTAKVAAATSSSDINAIQEFVGNFPNPFNPTTTIRFALKEPADVKLQIFNISGQVVRSILDQRLDSGRHERLWDGKNNFGRSVATGIYFYRLRIGQRVLKGRMQLIK